MKSNLLSQIKAYIASQPADKARDLLELHELISNISPDAKLWFLDGTNEQGKVVSNPNIGYGSYNITYADGSNKEFYQIGLSANTGGISMYVMGLADKNYLSKIYAQDIGKAKLTGYCVKFKTVKDLDRKTLERLIGDGFNNSLRK